MESGATGAHGAHVQLHVVEEVRQEHVTAIIQSLKAAGKNASVKKKKLANATPSNVDVSI